MRSTMGRVVVDPHSQPLHRVVVVAEAAEGEKEAEDRGVLVADGGCFWGTFSDRNPNPTSSSLFDTFRLVAKAIPSGVTVMLTLLASMQDLPLDVLWLPLLTKYAGARDDILF